MSESYGTHGLRKVASTDLTRDALATTPNANVEAIETALANCDPLATGDALPIERGGTGATTAKAARRNLGIHTDLTWGDIKQALTWGQLRDG